MANYYTLLCACIDRPSFILTSSFVRFHVGSEQGVDPCLIAGPLGLEPLKNALIKSNGYSGFRLREDKSCRLEKVFVQFGNIRVIDVAIR